MHTLRFILFAVALLGWHTPSALAVLVVTGTYAGDNTDNRNITISPACQPKAVFAKRTSNITGNSVFKNASMTGDNTSLISSAVTFNADLIQAINSNGFQVGVSLNGTGNTYAYLALCDNGANDLAEGTFTGNGSDNRDITISPAFSPEFVFLIANANQQYVFRTTSMSGDKACTYNSGVACASNKIQQFNSNGFQVGTVMNVNTTAYYYIAIKGSALGVASGSYTGNATDNRDITAGFAPAGVFIKGDSTSNEAAGRFSSHSGDDSFCDTGAATTNIIQGFGSTTFQVGTDGCVNENAVTMYWVAIATVSPSRGARGPLYTE